MNEKCESDLKEQQDYLEKWIANKLLKQNKRKERIRKMKEFLKGKR